MRHEQPNIRLHGVTLEKIVISLVKQYGWADLAEKIRFNCFKKDAFIKSSLKFLRKTPWAREHENPPHIRLASRPISIR